MAYIKNISHEEVLHLADQVSADKGQIVSKTLAQNDHVSVTLFAFSKDEEIATHDSTGDAMVLVLEGTGQFTVDGKEYILQAGDAARSDRAQPAGVHLQGEDQREDARRNRRAARSQARGR